MSTTTIYGISNCDTVRKARKWLQADNINAHYHDFRKDGLEAALLQQWIDSAGWETLLNKRGQSWRKLPDSDKQDVDANKAKTLMLQEPTLIKRPVLVHNGQVEVGFSDSRYREIFA